MNKKIIYLLLAALAITGIVVTVLITSRNPQKNETTTAEIGATSVSSDDASDEQKPSSADAQSSSADNTDTEQRISPDGQDAETDIGTPVQTGTEEHSQTAAASDPIPADKNETLESIEIIPSAQEESDLPVLEIDSADASAGDADVALAVRIKKNPGILGMSFILHYDDEALRLTKAKNGDAFSELRFTAPKNFGNGCVFTWYGESLDENEIRDGIILTLHFSVSDSAKKNNYSVELVGYDGNCYDKDLSEVSFDVHNGSVDIK